jgi:hypothetical protein
MQIPKSHPRTTESGTPLGAQGSTEPFHSPETSELQKQLQPASEESKASVLPLPAQRPQANPVRASVPSTCQVAIVHEKKWKSLGKACSSEDEIKWE